MISVSGKSYNNGIQFNSTNYSVSFESYLDETKIFLHKTQPEKVSKILDFMFKIPFIRGFALLLNDFKLLFLFWSLSFIYNMITIRTKTEMANLSLIFIIINTIISCIIMLYILAKMLKNFKSTRQYHGAEHKVIFVNYEEKLITFENCLNAPRISDNCGTMFVFLLIFSLIFTNILTSLLRINMWLCIQFIIAFIAAYELFLLERNTPVIRWIFKFGYWFQNICTLEPSNFQLNQAIEAFKLLENAETGKISSEELQKLLKNSKQANFLNKLF